MKCSVRRPRSKRSANEEAVAARQAAPNQNSFMPNPEAAPALAAPDAAREISNDSM